MRPATDFSHAIAAFLSNEAAASPLEYALLGSIVLAVGLLLLLALGKDLL